MPTRCRPAAIAADLPLELDRVRLATPTDHFGLPLHLPQAETFEEARSKVADQALRWTYVLRSRRRWVGDSRARERNDEQAREALDAIGVGEPELGSLANCEVVVVRIPYVGEEMHWESRIFPWEYVLAAATRERRLQLARSGRPRALTVMRELQCQPVRQVPPVHQPGPGDPLRVLFVECLPSELRENWSLASERVRLRRALPADTGWTVLSDPTAEELRAAVCEHRPHLLHFAGLDSHQGLRELRLHFGSAAKVDIGPNAPRQSLPPNLGDDGTAGTPLPDDNLRLVDEVSVNPHWMVDGVLLKGDTGYPRLVRAHELSVQLAASGHCTYLTTFNMWNSAARVAPLVVAEGAALAAVGFQDAFDDALAEYFHATLYARLLDSGWNLPEAFRATWLTVRDLPESVDATGITLWAGSPLLGDPSEPQASERDGRGAAAPGPSPPPVLACEIEPFDELNYAVLHNGQPLFQKFIIECDRPGANVSVDVDVAVHMGSETARYSRRLVMNSPRIALTRAIHVPLTAQVVRSVREAVSSSLVIKVTSGEQVLYCETHRLRLLPVDQWRDNRRDGRWLPSFVQPRDPAVARAVELAQRYNRVLRDDPNAGFEGYQLADPKDEDSLRGVDRQVEALWATLLHDWQLGYVNPPPTYSGALDSQRLRMPSLVHEQHAGTCIDLALLFAGCLELIDIYPVIFLLDGHALPGWWRHASFRDEYADMPLRNYADVVHATATENSAANAQVVAWHTGKASWGEIRRWIRERKLVPIETVRLTEHCSFVEAIEAGVGALAEPRDFDSMIDIVTARLKQVTPLPMLKEGP